jgi:glycosyltransferase involved in cell wall biosynthesis
LSNKTILIFSPGFAENEQDSTCIPALQQFVLEAKKIRPDLELKVFSLHYPFTEGSYLWNGVECYSFGGKNRGGFYGIYLRYKVKKHLKKVIQEGNAQALLSIWMLDCANIAEKLSRSMNVRHFCWMHGQDARPGNKFVSKIKPKPEQVIAISDILQKEFHRNYGIRSEYVIENGIGEEIFPEFNSGERPIDVLGVGSLTSHKNYSLFVDVIAQLKREFPQLNAMLIGDGPQRAMLQDKIDSLGLNSSLKLTGSIPRREVLKYMNNAKVFLHTSSYEGSSGVIIEALYSGCNVVSTISVSLKPVKNVELSGEQSGLVQKIASLLREKDMLHERVTYNTMRNSAEQLLSVILKK